MIYSQSMEDSCKQNIKIQLRKFSRIFEFRNQNQFRFCTNIKSNHDIILQNDSEIIIQENAKEENIIVYPTEKELDLLTWKD